MVAVWLLPIVSVLRVIEVPESVSSSGPPIESVAPPALHWAPLASMSVPASCDTMFAIESVPPLVTAMTDDEGLFHDCCSRSEVCELPLSDKTPDAPETRNELLGESCTECASLLTV